MTEAGELLAGVHALRRRARADRHAYWFPLLFFGLATAASAPLYVQHVVVLSTDADRTNALYGGPADAYRFEQLPALVLPALVLLIGGLLAAPWSRRDR